MRLRRWPHARGRALLLIYFFIFEAVLAGIRGSLQSSRRHRLRPSSLEGQHQARFPRAFAFRTLRQRARKSQRKKVRITQFS